MLLNTYQLQSIFERTRFPKPALEWVLMNVESVNRSVASLLYCGSIVSDEMIFDLTCEAYWINCWANLVSGEDFQKWGHQIRHSLREFSTTLYDDKEYWESTNCIIPSVFKDSAEKIRNAYCDAFLSKYGVDLLKQMNED